MLGVGIKIRKIYMILNYLDSTSLKKVQEI